MRTEYNPAHSYYRQNQTPTLIKRATSIFKCESNPDSFVCLNFTLTTLWVTLTLVTAVQFSRQGIRIRSINRIRRWWTRHLGCACLHCGWCWYWCWYRWLAEWTLGSSVMLIGACLTWRIQIIAGRLRSMLPSMGNWTGARMEAVGKW